MLQIRKMSVEWRDTINHELATKVVALYLFDDSHSVGQYMDFLWVSNLDTLPEYEIRDDRQTWPSLVLFVKDMKALVDQADRRLSLLNRLVSVTNLTPIARPALKPGVEETGNELDRPNDPPLDLYQESWHVSVPKLISIFANIDTLVVQHWGYFKPYVDFKALQHCYHNLKLIQLIQPSAHAIQSASETPFLVVAPGYSYDGGVYIGARKCATKSTVKYKVNVFYHLMTKWYPRHSPSVYNPDHRIEPYPQVRNELDMRARRQRTRR